MKLTLFLGPCSVFLVMCQKKNDMLPTDHGSRCILCGFSQNSPTKQLLRKKILKKNLYRPGILGELGIMSKINPYLLPVVPVVPVQKLSN